MLRMYKRYIVILVSIILAIVLDAIIYVGILGVPYGLVPTLYHVGNIVMLAAALALIGDSVFKAGVLK
ncbi:MAG: hypothetical protein GY759_21085 [Chloroflexi bacterium]|nr:hypothetical protein [Chloroflexota bacterium]